jgi:hypothetical protein
VRQEWCLASRWAAGICMVVGEHLSRQYVGPSYMGHSMATSRKLSGRTNGVLRTLAAAHPSVAPAVLPSTRSEPHQVGAGRLVRMSRFILLLLPLSLGGCLSFSSSNPPPPNQNTTIVVPPGSTVVCSNGSPPPCQ